MQLRARRGNVQRVRLIFAKFLDRFALLIRGNQQGRFCGINFFSIRKHEGRLAMELFQEPLARTLQPRLSVTRKSQAEGFVTLRKPLPVCTLAGMGIRFIDGGDCARIDIAAKASDNTGSKTAILPGKRLRMGKPPEHLSSATTEPIRGIAKHMRLA